MEDFNREQVPSDDEEMNEEDGNAQNNETTADDVNATDRSRSNLSIYLPNNQVKSQLHGSIFASYNGTPVVYSKTSKEMLDKMLKYKVQPPPYEDVVKENVRFIKQKLKTDSKVEENNVLNRLQAIELSTSETGGVVRDMQQTLRQHIVETRDRHELMERTVQASHVSEERISERVTDQLLNNERFLSLMQSRESSVTRSEVTESVTGDPSSLSHKHCCCTRTCTCSCHLTDLNEKWKRERQTNSPDGRYTGLSRNRRKENVEMKYVTSDIESDADVVKDFENNLSHVSDSDRQTPRSELRNTEKFEMSSLKEEQSKESFMVYGASGGDPGGPPSDDSSSDDDSGDRRWNKRNRDAQKSSEKKAKKWIIDADAWKMCVELAGDFEIEAARLLDQGKLPNQVILNELCSKYTRDLPCLQNICDEICSFIKTKSETIVHVWPAYKYEHDDSIYGKVITFVVLSTASDINGITDFTTVKRCIYDVKGNKENAEIHEKETKDRPSYDEIEGLEKCLKEHARELMKRHSKLTRVTASWFKSSGNETDTVSLTKRNCIALYVQVKGFIPLNEEPFPKRLGGYLVDVREGIFELCRGPKDYHKNIKMGCAITGEERQEGTLGTFVKFENDSRVFGITSAHVIFAGEKLKEILKRGHVEFKYDSTENVYQPFRDIFGNVRLALYKQGGNGIPGMEIVLMEVKQDRWPSDGSFPDDSNHFKFGFGPEKPYEFCSGRVTELTDRLHSSVVYKYGCESKITEGVHRFSGASVRSNTFKDNILDEELIIHDQIEVMDIDGGTFAIQGDSGALVVTDEHRNGKLSAVGILEGKMAGGNVYTVTPINAVLNELSRFYNRQCSLKSFWPFISHSGDPELGKEVMEKVSSLTANVTNLREKLIRIDQGLAQDLAEHKNELSDQLRKQNEEHKKETQEIKEQQTTNSNEMNDKFRQVLDLLNSMRQNTS